MNGMKLFAGVSQVRPGWLLIFVAVIVFERGSVTLTLWRHGEGLVWFHGAEPFSGPFVSIGAARRFLRRICVLHNRSLELR